MSSPSETDGPRDLRSRRREATRQEILAAAQVEFMAVGVHEAKMEDIATRAGVSVGTLYNYFDDRKALLRSLWEHHHVQITAAIDQGVAAAHDFPQALRTFIRCLAEHMGASSGFVINLMEAQIREDTETGKRRWKELYARADALCRRGLAEGFLRTEDVEHFPAMLLGSIRATLVVVARNHGTSGDEVVDALFRFFLHGAARSTERSARGDR